jgi:hypothetical protein
MRQRWWASDTNPDYDWRREIAKEMNLESISAHKQRDRECVCVSVGWGQKRDRSGDAYEENVESHCEGSQVQGRDAEYSLSQYNRYSGERKYLRREALTGPVVAKRKNSENASTMKNNTTLKNENAKKS